MAEGAGPGYLWARWIWLRALGLIFFSAFYSLAFQIQGLIGSRGMLPAADLLHEVQRQISAPERFWYAPTLLWLGAGHGALAALWIAGLVASTLLVLGVWPRATIAICEVLFLSFIAAARNFASYQSDGMLLEAGFISLFLAPAGLWPGLGARDPPSPLARFLLVWEWFRIYFESGIVKLASGDVQWRTLTAMDHYYENGPLPSWIGWYMQQLPPHWFHQVTVVMVFVFELGLVWLAFGPRLLRRICFLLVTPFQAVIILTANYAFLNYIVLALGIFLLDDEFFQRRLRAPTSDVVERPAWRRWLERLALGWVIYATLAVFPLVSRQLPRAVLWPAIALEPFRIANRYGLFAVMTEERFEIEFQGSRDGREWIAYPFRYKPQDPKEAPGIYAPYQPRFEWNLWFASLASWRDDPWVVRAEALLLEGEPSVLSLFRRDPFAGQKPRRVRAVLWKYWFTAPAEKRKTGAWWNREERGLYAPELARRSDGSIEMVDEPE